METLINWLEKYFLLIKMNPMSYFWLALIMLSTGFWFGSLLSQSQILGLKTNIEVLDGRINGLKEQIEDYKQRLALVPPSNTVYSKLTNAELKKAAIDHVEKLRAFAVRVNSEENAFFYQDKSNNGAEFSKKISDQRFQHETEFRSSFLVASLGFRDELMKRFPKQTVTPAWTVMGPGVPTFSSYIANTADSVERLINLLG